LGVDIPPFHGKSHRAIKTKVVHSSSKGEWKKMEAKLYVGNLSYSTSEDNLRTLFSQAGTVVSVALVKDRDTGRSKGFAFVEMSSQAEAEQAIKLFNGQSVDSRELKVNIARPREERPARFNNRSGGSRRY
jgi:RNA recognition motif-containing protein